MRQINSLKQAAEMSIDNIFDNRGSFNANFSIQVNGDIWDVYEISISDRDILCISDRGDATFLVDSYGDRIVIELFDYELELTNLTKS